MPNPGDFCCKIQVECCAQSRNPKASTPDLTVDPIPNEFGSPNVINTQPARKSESMNIKESSDEGALSSSTVTMTDSPTTPTRVYDPNNASRLPEPQVDQYTRGVSSREMFGEYEGSENILILANMRASSLSRPQGDSSLPTFPEPRYDQSSRSVPRDSFRQYQGTGDTVRQTNIQVPPPQRHGNLPTLPESKRELYHPSVYPPVIGSPSTSPEPKDEAYSPSIPPQVIFGQRHGTSDTLPKIRLGTSRPL